MGGEFSFDDFILENDPSRELTSFEVEAIQRAIAIEEAAIPEERAE